MLLTTTKPPSIYYDLQIAFTAEHITTAKYYLCLLKEKFKVDNPILSNLPTKRNPYVIMYHISENRNLCFRPSDKKIMSLDAEHLKFNDFIEYEPICVKLNMRDVVKTFYRCQSYFNKYEASGSIKSGNFAYTTIQSPICKNISRYIGFTKKSLLDRLMAPWAVEPFIFKINDPIKET